MYYDDAARHADFGVSYLDVRTLEMFAPEAFPSGSTIQVPICYSGDDVVDHYDWDSTMIWRERT
jgi:hypothetical protein